MSPRSLPSLNTQPGPQTAARLEELSQPDPLTRASVSPEPERMGGVPNLSEVERAREKIAEIKQPLTPEERERRKEWRKKHRPPPQSFLASDEEQKVSTSFTISTI